MSRSFLFFALMLILLPLCRAIADQPSIVYVIQAEPMLVPEDNRGYYTPARELTMRLDLLASVETLDDALVTLIRPDGETSEFEPDEDLQVTLDDLESGPHVVVASSRQAHGTMFVNLEAAPDELAPPDEAAQPDPLAAGLEAEPEKPLRMTMLAIRPQELRPFIEDLRAVDDTRSMDLVQPNQSDERFDFRVMLAEDGTLYGRVISVMNRESAINLEGTRVVVFRDGQSVGTTNCDRDGKWSLAGMQPGVHGVIASGPAGYTAFAFELVDSSTIVMTNSNGKQFASRLAPPAIAEELPLVLAPPPFFPYIDETITDYNRGLVEPVEPLPLATTGEPVALPVGGSMVSPTSLSPTSTGPGGGGGVGSGAGAGGAGLVAAFGGAAALAAGSRGGGSRFPFPPTTASPAIPGDGLFPGPGPGPEPIPGEGF